MGNNNSCVFNRLNINGLNKTGGRERYVDIGKGLAMMAVVCGHICSTWFPGWLTSFWPVAFFFVVAGFYIKEESLLKPVKFIGHKLKTIYLPGTVIYLLAVLLHNPLVNVLFSASRNEI